MRQLTLEETRELYEFLQRKFTPKGFQLKHPPKLSKLAAFEVIYVLQEYFKIIPDHYERCSKCGDLFDTDREGVYIERTNRHYCDCKWGEF